jgi:plastocyanin
MRALRLLPLLALTGLVPLAAPAASASWPAPAAVQSTEDAKIVDFDFSPGQLTVQAGTTVTWTNTGQRPHTATDRGGTFDTRPIAPGASGKVTLSTPGTYLSFCRINPAKMNGVLVVEPGPDDVRAVRVQAVDPGFTGDKFRFDPDRLTVAAGTTPLVANVGGKPHTLTADDGSFDTGTIDPGGSAKVTAPDAPGSYSYRCTVHPGRMRGGPGAGVSAFVLAAAVVAAFLGGIGISAFALRRPAA